VVEKRKREMPYSVQAALHLKNATSAVFEYAKTVGMYSGENPASHIRLPEMTRKEKHSLTVEQMKLVLLSFPSPAREMSNVAVLTSMNIAEICGLQWKYVNLSSSWVIVDGEPIPPMAIAVRRQWSTRKGGGAYHSLKAGTRRRNLPIDSALEKILRGVASRSTATGPDDPCVRIKHWAAGGCAQSVQPRAEANRY
jgi:integrase